MTDKEAYYDGRGYGSALCAVEGIVAILAGGAAIIGGGIVGFGGGLLSLSGFGSVAGAPALALSGELIAAGGLAIEGGIGMVGSSYDKIEVYKLEAANSSEAKVKEKADKLNEAKVGSATKGVGNRKPITGYEGIERFRGKSGLKPYSIDSGDTVASITIDNNTYFGVNSTITKESQKASKALR